MPSEGERPRRVLQERLSSSRSRVRKRAVPLGLAIRPGFANSGEEVLHERCEFGLRVEEDLEGILEALAVLHVTVKSEGKYALALQKKKRRY